MSYMQSTRAMADKHTNIATDYIADAGDRLMALMAANGTPQPLCQKLEPAARRAGEQLELLKPAMMGMSRNGFRYGPVAMVERSTLLVIVANKKHVITLHMRDHPDRLLFIEEWARSVKDAFVATDGWDARHMLAVAKEFLKAYGAAPGKAGRPLRDELSPNLIGALFAALDSRSLRDAFKKIDDIAHAGICPAIVGLIGDGTKMPGTLSGVWPLLLPLAPYVDRDLGEPVTGLPASVVN